MVGAERKFLQGEKEVFEIIFFEKWKILLTERMNCGIMRMYQYIHKDKGGYTIMMNTFKKAICVLGTAAMLSSVFAIGASAKLPVIYKPEQIKTSVSAVANTMAELYGEKYYDAEADEVKIYFESNAYAFSMTVGEAKVLASDVLFYSENTEIVSFDKTTGALKANAKGKTSVYACTEYGVPFMKLDITVKEAKTLGEQLSLCPGNRYLNAIGDKTDFKVTFVGKKYSDIVYEIVSGKDYAYIKNGKLIAKGYGPVVVRAYSKAFPKVCGETIVYVGKYDTPVYDCDWQYFDNSWHFAPGYTGGVVTTKPNKGNYVLGGWIKTDEGMMLPIITFKNATSISGNTTTIATTSFVTMSDLFACYYGDKGNCKPVNPGASGVYPIPAPGKPDCKPQVNPGVTLVRPNCGANGH